MSSAVKLFFRQLIIAGNFPCELRDENGFTLKNADALRQALQDAPGSKRSFRTGRALVKDALKD
jgi:antitoxin component of RelBE/YafQ-DinJ toxin-antitoxin module